MVCGLGLFSYMIIMKSLKIFYSETTHFVLDQYHISVSWVNLYQISRRNFDLLKKMGFVVGAYFPSIVSEEMFKTHVL